jgi:hypothetical protein
MIRNPCYECNREGSDFCLACTDWDDFLEVADDMRDIDLMEANPYERE